MSPQNLALLVLVLGYVVFVGVRQLRWSPIVESRLWRQPVILAAVGVFLIYRSLGSATPDAADVGLLVVEAVIALGIGWAMGALTRFRPLARPTETARLESSSGRIGLVLWILYILVRIGFGVWTAYSGSEVLDATGVILVMIGLNRLGRAGVLVTRLNRFAPVAA